MSLVASGDFFSGDTVYYRANENFLLGTPKTEKLQYLVLEGSEVLSALKKGTVDIVTPQLTPENSDYMSSDSFASDAFASVTTWENGYGYIGINARYVTNRYLRYAIMAAMDTSLALNYYAPQSAVNISWGMSATSWAYPRNDGRLDSGVNENTMKMNNGHAYACTLGLTDELRIELIQEYMKQAGVQAHDPSLKFKFTLIGASMTEHPCYLVFLHAADLLNRCGWDVRIQADSQGLARLATGTLEVWAAERSSSLDPDLYQLWHKNSTATDVLAWGYDAILADRNRYNYENNVISELSAVIDEARSMTDRYDRALLYEQALGFILDLGVELPVYQRKTCYAFNLNTINESSLAHSADGTLLSNPYSTPFDRIWEIELN